MSIRSWSGRVRRRYMTRLVIGLLVVALPIMVAIVVILTRSASGRLTENTKLVLANQAQLVAGQVDAYLTERRHELRVMGATLTGYAAGPALDAELSRLGRSSDTLRALQLTDLSGHTLSATAGQADIDPTAAPWFRDAVGGGDATSPPERTSQALRLVLAHPIRGSDGAVRSILLGDVNLANLSAVLVSSRYARTGETYIASGDHHLVLSSRAGLISSAIDVVRAGGGLTVTQSAPVLAALRGESGAMEAADYTGAQVVAGYAGVPSVGWAVVAKENRSEALAGATSLRDLSIGVILVAAAVLVLAATGFARRESRYLHRLVTEIRETGASVTGRAQELSSASTQLASTTTEQSAAVTEISATMEELARTAGAIAETVDRVATQLTEARQNLRQAQGDIAASGERALALSGRVKDVGAILSLINEIADQTSLLALNAAIEAARAGESGRGFAVVAEEVRRLAERSKSSAAEIAEIVSGVEAENSATVLAMEAGSKQVDRTVGLIEDVTLGGEQVRLTTQQQRTATEQVVTSMEQISDGSRQVTSTAQQIASTASAMSDVARDLDRSAADTAARL